ncbi:glycosyltransferase family 4 protein [Winogradskyella maritima]|uniref:Glycosyltransferase family 4 protein n=1 Tax=Winogradskyella maritima TaxID=1517766 RepID=A0ABV8AHR2_9FLAO|nr:glycosyltransferase family 4 protein [Winogradskyella maritima]
MKNLLYVGNNLSTAKTNLSSIQNLGRTLEDEGYQLRYASHFARKPLRLVHMLWATLRYSKWADKVIIDTYSTQNFYYAVAVAQLCRCLGLPYICSLNGGNLPYRLEQNPKHSKALFGRAQYNVSPSRYLQQAFKTQGFEEVLYIPNSIAIDQYPITKKTFDSIRLLWVRSFSKIYNPEMAIEVLQKLKTAGYTVELCMVGPDSDSSMAKVKALASSKGLQPRITGKLTKPEWIALSQDYNIFINTTDYDNMPVSVVEAMALGFPIVSTNPGGMPYLIEDGKDGLLVKTGDTNAMCQAIIRIYEDAKLRKALRFNARSHAEHFDWQNVKERWHMVLND